jgi:hypothetical protein
LYLKEAAVKLQNPSQDIVSGFSVISTCSGELKGLRENVDEYSHRLYLHSSKLAEKSKITITMPRVSQRQQHRSNPQCTSIEEYYKTTVAIPFLDHLLNELSNRFETHSKHAASLQMIIPARFTVDSSMTDIEEAISFYSDDLPNKDIIDEEFHIWKTRWLSAPTQNRPQTLTGATKQCCPQSLPNIFTLLKLFATLPLSSCSCERSASALRRLNTYLRCTQTEERLSALALIHANYDTNVDVDEVCKLFIEKHPRRIECANLLFESV